MITELVIDRKLWGTGAMLNRDGTMCCLGHLSKACGVPENEMRYEDGIGNISFPKLTWINKYDLNSWAVDSIEMSEAAQINDSKLIPDSQKEIELIQLFKDNGITLSFVGSK